MSQTFLDLRHRPRALFNCLIIQGFFLPRVFPWTLFKEKTPRETVRQIQFQCHIKCNKCKSKLTEYNNDDRFGLHSPVAFLILCQTR